MEIWGCSANTHTGYINKESAVLSSVEICADDQRSQRKMIMNTLEQVQALHCIQDLNHWLEMKMAFVLNLSDKG